MDNVAMDFKVKCQGQIATTLISSYLPKYWPYGVDCDMYTHIINPNEKVNVKVIVQTAISSTVPIVSKYSKLFSCVTAYLIV